MTPSPRSARRARVLAAALTTALCGLGAVAACASFKGEGSGATPGEDASSDAPVTTRDDATAVVDGFVDVALDSAVLDSAASGDSGSSEDAGAAGDASVCTQTTCTVTTVISNLYGPAALAVDPTYIYWLEVGTGIPQADGEGEFVRLQKGTTCTDRSCVAVIDPYALSGTFEDQLIYDNLVALTPDDACYSQSYNATSEHSIYCFPLATLDKTSIDQDYGDCDSLWASPASLLWTLASSTATSSDGSVRTHSLSASDGGPAPIVAGGRPNPTAVIGDATGVVWTETGVGDAGGSVLTLTADGGVSLLAIGRAGPAALAEYAGYVYWIDADARTISRIPRAGGAIEQIANTDANPFALAVDASGVYWAAAGLTSPTGSVAHAPLVPGGPTTVMMSSLVNIEAMAVDPTTVYVAALGGTVNGGGSIVALPKTR